MAASVKEIVDLVETHAHSDFYLPASIVAALSTDVISARRLVHLSADRFFLLAPDSEARQLLPLRWNMPQEW
jgi:hypothetical protein